MLKERINFLCEKKGISRKELVKGLITVPHLSNILSGRYLLADDLAAEFAKRLDVSPEYLLQVADISASQLKEIDNLLLAVMQESGGSDELLNSIPERQDSLIVELAGNLLKACLYQKKGDLVNYQRLADEYLRFYLAELPESTIVLQAVSLQKVYFYFYMDYASGKSKSEQVLYYAEKLLPLVGESITAQVNVQTSQVDALIKLFRYDEANQIVDELFRQVQVAGALEKLSALYILKCGINFNLHLFQEALICLAKAEESLGHIKQPNNSFTIIAHNRIVLLLRLGKFNEAAEELARLDEAYKNAGHQDNPEIQAYILFYQCEIAFCAEDWQKLADIVNQLADFQLGEPQAAAISFYHAYLSWQQNELVTAETIALDVLPYFQKEAQHPQLIPLYELLANINEQNKKYKQANEYNKDVIKLLKKTN